MKTREMNDKVVAVMDRIEELVEKKSSNKNPDYYKTLKEYKMWRVIYNLVILNDITGEIDLDKEVEQMFNELIEGGNKKTFISLEEGDDVIEYMAAHPTVKYENIKKYLEKKGLILKGSKVSK